MLLGLLFLKVEWTKLEKSRSFTLIILDMIARHFTYESRVWVFILGNTSHQEYVLDLRQARGVSFVDG